MSETKIIARIFEKEQMNTKTTNLEEFGSRERRMLYELLKAWDEQGLPEDFYEDKVMPMMNKNSGFVFLTNDEFQVCMLNGKELESFYSCPNCGEEGFAEDITLTRDGCTQCDECDECDDCREIEEVCASDCASV